MKRIMNLFIAAIVVIAIAVSIPTAYYFFTQEKQHWAMPAIEGLNQNGIHIDWPEGELDKPITRGEFASLCVNAFNTGADDGSPLPFGDVPDTHPFYAGVAAAYRNGWISGVDGQTFDPDGALTREQAVIVFCKISSLDTDDPSPADAFTDLPAGYYAKKQVAAAVQNGMVAGFPDQTFRPSDAITKAEAASMIYRVFQWKQNNQADTTAQRAFALQYMQYLSDSNTHIDAMLTASSGMEQLNNTARKEVLPFLTENGLYQARSFDDMNLIISNATENTCTARASYRVRYGDEVSYLGETKLYLKRGENGWQVDDSYQRLHRDGTIKLVWEYASRPDMEYTNQNGANIVSPTWFKLLNDKNIDIAPNDVSIASGEVGNIYLSDYGSDIFLKTAQERGQKVWGLFSNGFDPDINRLVITDEATRRNMLREVLKKAKKYNLEGINVDFENMYVEDKDLFTQMVKELSLYARECGLIVSVDVTKISPNSNFYSMCYDRPALSRYADYIMLMAYDQHARSSKVAGSIASLDWTEDGLKGVLEQVDNNKLVLAVPFYTRVWEEEGGVVTDAPATTMQQMQDLIEEKGLAPVWNDEASQNYVEYSEDSKIYKAWIEDEESMVHRLGLVKQYHLAGVAGWSGGYETPQIWEVINRELP